MIKRNITKCFIILSLLLILFVTIPMVSANQTGQDTCDNQYLTDNQDIDNHQDIITNDMEKQSYETNIKKEAEENSIYASADAQATGTGTYEDPYNITNAFNSTNYNQKDKIILKEGTYNLKKVLTIAKSTANLTITSEGQVILNGLNSNAILDIKTDNTITIENIIFTNGTLESSNGGAIINAANLTINNCNFTNNKASSAGAIYNNKGILTINNSCFESNEATGSGTNGYSGCIQNAQGNCTISNSKFINNVAGSRAGVSYNNKGNLTFDTNNIIENNTGLFGGALYNYQGTLNINNNNTFRGNYITNNYAGVLHNDNGNVTIRNGNKFLDNNGFSFGGVINSKLGNILIQDDNEFRNNTANRGAVINTTGNLTIENSNIFEDNYATYAGGAIYTNGGSIVINNKNRFNNNTGNYYGGTLYLWNTMKTSINDTTINNTHGNDGGAIYINTGSKSIEISNSNFYNSSATQNGGAINTKVPISITNCSFIDNSAANGGAIYSENETAESQIIYSRFVNVESANETLNLPGITSMAGNNYTNVSILHDDLMLSLDGDKTSFNPGEDIAFTISCTMTNPSYYDADILSKFDSIVYLNDEEYGEVTGDSYTLNLADGGSYTTYIKSLTLNDDSNTVSFTVGESEANFAVNSVSVANNNGNLLVLEDAVIAVQVENSGNPASATVTVTVDGQSSATTLEDFAGTYTINTTYTPQTSGDKDVKVEVTYSDETPQTLYEGTITAYYNGYMGKSFTKGDNFTTKREYTGENTLILEQFNYYNWNENTQAIYDASQLAGDKIVDVLYYQGYNWNKYLNFTLLVNGNESPIIAQYSDTKGFASYNYPTGLVVFNITQQFIAGETNTIVPTPLENNSNILYGGYLIIIYANNTNMTTILINEETDLLNPEASGLTTSDYTKAYSIYDCVEETPNVTLYTITAAADKAGESKIIFNDVEYACMADNYDSVSKLSIVTSDITNVQEGTNTVTLHSTGDNLAVLGTILVTSKEQPPEMTITINPSSVTAGESIDITASITGNDVANKGKVYFKVNGKTLKDADGKVIYVKVVDGVATATYDVPLDMSGKELNVTAVYSGSSKYGKLTAGTTVTVEQATPTLTITPFEEAVPTGSTVTFKAKVALAETPITTGKIVFKINGKTVKDANGKVIYAKLDSNGEVSVDYNLGDLKANTYTVEAVFIASGYDRLESNTTLTVVKA